MKELVVRELDKGYLVIERRSREYDYLMGREFTCTSIQEAAETVAQLLAGVLDGVKNVVP